MTARRNAVAPAAFAALLAGALACTETREPPVAVGSSPLADSADQLIFGARQFLTDQGLQRARLRADTAFFFNEGTRIELRGVNTEFYNTTGAKTGTLTSREGTYNTQLGQMSARKNVVVVSEDGRRLTTQQLQFSEHTNLITSDSAFVVTQGNRRLEGVGFESDPNMTSVRCKAACRGELGAVAVPQGGSAPAAPSSLPAAGSRPNSFILPGQAVPPPTPPTTASPAGPPAVPPAAPPPTDTSSPRTAGQPAPAATPPAATPPAAATPPGLRERRR
jgi:LPS export ABC transporter protein LptC